MRRVETVTHASYLQSVSLSTDCGRRTNGLHLAVTSHVKYHVNSTNEAEATRLGCGRDSQNPGGPRTSVRRAHTHASLNGLRLTPRPKCDVVQTPLVRMRLVRSCCVIELVWRGHECRELTRAVRLLCGVPRMNDGSGGTAFSRLAHRMNDGSGGDRILSPCTPRSGRAHHIVWLWTRLPM